jgi:hypothetical protein
MDQRGIEEGIQKRKIGKNRIRGGIQNEFKTPTQDQKRKEKIILFS